MFIQSTKTNVESSKKGLLQEFSGKEDGILVMFAAVGLNPVSTTLAGALIELNAAVLLVCAGILMVLFTLSAAFSPPVRAGME